MKTLLIPLQSDFDFSFLKNLWADFVAFLPKLLLGVGFLIIVWIILKVVLYLVKKALGFTNIDKLPERLKIDEIFGESNIKIEPTKIILKTISYSPQKNK